MRLALAALLLAGCRREEPAPVRGDDRPPADARAIVIVPVDAPAPPPSPPCDTQPFAFGRFDLPAGWCWRRTAEGDDLSGELRDATQVVRMTYQMLAHGTRVEDVCRRRPERTSERTEVIAGLRVRTCELANGHTCFAFPNANLCTTDAAFDARALLRTLQR